jgi:uncharacterized protein YutE (UPF0331/DUF86 family)
MASITGFRNILFHDCLEIDWDEIYYNLNKLSDMSQFMDHEKGRKKKSILDD